MVSATRRNPGDGRWSHNERNGGRSNREYQRSGGFILGDQSNRNRAGGRRGVAGWRKCVCGGGLTGSAYRCVELGGGWVRRGGRGAAGGQLGRRLWTGTPPLPVRGRP